MVILFSILGAASAATINVDPGTDAIKNAINNSQSGDTLNLSSGTYYEHDLVVDKDLNIEGPAYSDTPSGIIDAQNQGRIFTISTGVTLNLKNLILQNGNTTDDGGAISNSGTLTINNSTIKNNTAGNDGGGIANIGGTVTITDSIISNNTAPNNGGGVSNYDGNITVNRCDIEFNEAANDGGGICSIGALSELSVTNSTIRNNIAGNSGGGIVNMEGTVTVTNSTINNNDAANDGGGISNNWGNVTVTNSSIKNNTAGNAGGGIANSFGIMTVTGCDFESNVAAGDGNAIWDFDDDSSNRIVHFNRFYNPSTGFEIYCASGTVDAMYNWWCSNGTPANKVSGNVTYKPWLILKLIAPTLMAKNSTSTITANLRYDSNGGYHNPTTGHLPNGLSVTFTITKGSISTPKSLIDGTATTTLNSGTASGLTTISAKLNNQTVNTSLTIDTTPPTVVSSSPANGSTNVSSSKTITVTFNEAIKKGSNFKVELKNSSGTVIACTSGVSGKVLTVDPKYNLAESLYTLIIPYGSVTDLLGNPVGYKSIKFSVGTPPKLISTTPTHLKTGVTRTGLIAIKFNKNIYAGTNYGKITLKNLTTGKTTTITKAIGKNMLYIKNSFIRSANTWYQVIIPAGAVKDKAGNIQTTTYTFRFKTGRT